MFKRSLLCRTKDQSSRLSLISKLTYILYAVVLGYFIPGVTAGLIEDQVMYLITSSGLKAILAGWLFCIAGHTFFGYLILSSVFLNIFYLFVGWWVPTPFLAELIYEFRWENEGWNYSAAYLLVELYYVSLALLYGILMSKKVLVFLVVLNTGYIVLDYYNTYFVGREKDCVEITLTENDTLYQCKLE